MKKINESDPILESLTISEWIRGIGKSTLKVESAMKGVISSGKAGPAEMKAIGSLMRVLSPYDIKRTETRHEIPNPDGEPSVNITYSESVSLNVPEGDDLIEALEGLSVLVRTYGPDVATPIMNMYNSIMIGIFAMMVAMKDAAGAAEAPEAESKSK